MYDSAPSQRANDWLLHSGIQISAPPEAGGVGGWRDSSGQVAYSYGEATGYFLSYLRFLQSVSAPVNGLQDRIRPALQWLLSRWVDADVPLTRCYLDGRQQEDWRNCFLFSFDLAMMLRGASCAFPCASVALAGPVVGGLVLRFRDFVDGDGSLSPSRRVRGGPAPGRWSLEPGPYQLKTAAAILAAHGAMLPQWLQRAAETTWERWVEFQLDAGMDDDELHPALYFLEGLLIRFGATSGREDLRRAAEAYRTLASSAALRRSRRSDCIAQALRAGCLLRNLGSLDRADEVRLEDLAGRLASFQGPDGAVYFCRSGEGGLQHANAWCTVFAAQAWWALRHPGDPLMAGALLRFLA